jgi:hypothetical protein
MEMNGEPFQTLEKCPITHTPDQLFYSMGNEYYFKYKLTYRYLEMPVMFTGKKHK